jgi:hypothetical protein
VPGRCNGITGSVRDCTSAGARCSMGEIKQQPLWHSFVAGATSGLAARIVTFPADTLKARLQIKGAVSGDVSQYRSTAAAAKHILTTEGAVGFFTGFGAVLWGVVPANLAYFGGRSGDNIWVPAWQAAVHPTFPHWHPFTQQCIC